MEKLKMIYIKPANNNSFKARVIAKTIIDDFNIPDGSNGLGQWLDVQHYSDHHALIIFAQRCLYDNPSDTELEIVNKIKKIIPKQYFGLD